MSGVALIFIFSSRTTVFGLSHMWSFYTPFSPDCEWVCSSPMCIPMRWFWTPPPPILVSPVAVAGLVSLLARIHVTAKHHWCALYAASWSLRPPVVCWTCLCKQLLMISKGKCGNEGGCGNSGGGATPPDSCTT